MKVFISGPLNNKNDWHLLKRFEAIKKWLTDNGYEVVLEIDIPYPDFAEDIEKIIDTCAKEPDQVDWLIMTMKKIWLLAQCDALFLLSNWIESHTCDILFLYAKKLGMPVYADYGEAIDLTNEDEIKNWFEEKLGQ